MQKVEQLLPPEEVLEVIVNQMKAEHKEHKDVITQTDADVHNHYTTCPQCAMAEALIRSRTMQEMMDTAARLDPGIHINVAMNEASMAAFAHVCAMFFRIGRSVGQQERPLDSHSQSIH